MNVSSQTLKAIQQLSSISAQYLANRNPEPKRSTSAYHFCASRLASLDGGAEPSHISSWVYSATSVGNSVVCRYFWIFWNSFHEKRRKRGCYCSFSSDHSKAVTTLSLTEVPIRSKIQRRSKFWNTIIEDSISWYRWFWGRSEGGFKVQAWIMIMDPEFHFVIRIVLHSVPTTSDFFSSVELSLLSDSLLRVACCVYSGTLWNTTDDLL